MQGSWIVISPSSFTTANQIREAVNMAYPLMYCMVFNHGSFDYAGTGPLDDAQRKRMAGWLQENWKP